MLFEKDLMFIERLQEAVFWINEKSQVIYANSHASRQLGYSQKELLGKSIDQFSTNETGVTFSELWKKISKNETYVFETKHIRKDKSRFSVEIKANYIKYGDKKFISCVVRDISYLRDLQRHWRETSNILEAMFDAIPDPIGILDHNYTPLRYNKAAKQLFGFEDDDYEGKKCYELVNNKLPCKICGVSEVYKTKTMTRKEKFVEAYSLWLDIRAYPIFNEEGELVKVIEHLRDITEHKRIIKALRESEARYRKLINSSHDAILIFNAQKVFLVNEKCWQITGYKPEDLKGKNLLSIIHKEDRERIKSVWQERMREEEVDPVNVVRVIGKKGQVIHIETIAGYINYKGQAAIMVTARDISRRKKAENALLESEKRYRTLVEQSHDLIIIYQNERIVFSNPKATEILGYTRPELGEMEIFKLIHPYDLKIVQDVITILNKGGDLPKLVDVRVISKEDKVIYLETRSTKIEYEGKEAILITARDATERKKTEEKFVETYQELLESEKEKSLSHYALDNAGEAIFLVNHAGNFMRVNDKTCELWGYSREELLNMHVSDINKSLRNNAWVKFWNQLEKEKIMSLDTTHFTKRGLYIPVHVTANMFKYNGEDFVMGFAVDISERKKAEEKIEEHLDEIKRLKNRLEAENLYLQDEIKLSHNFEDIVTRSDNFKRVLSNVEKVASTDSTVLILGETGTGKELMARAIHNISSRRKRPLVKVNCAALPASLIESELFGYEKGAFTGALTQKIGRFELADKGTIFLDEIGELPLELQPKLLRVIQDGEFERLGNPKTINVDVRIIAATNRNLEREVKDKKFRADLYYRLNVFPINTPPLRERKEDIPLLINHFILKFSAKHGKKIKALSQKTLLTLQKYHWPGNIRELENIIERAIIVSNNEELHLGDWFQKTEDISENEHIDSLEEFERKYILQILDLVSWKIRGDNGAARLLDMKPTTLEARMKKLDIFRNKNSNIS